jgi:hypothetical protein
VLVVVAIVAGVLSRRRAAERERVERERKIIAGELSGHRQEQDAIVSRAGGAADTAREHRAAAEEHEEQARRHEREAAEHEQLADTAEARFQRAQGAAERHGERAEEAQRRLDELEQRR